MIKENYIGKATPLWKKAVASGVGILMSAIISYTSFAAPAIPKEDVSVNLPSLEVDKDKIGKDLSKTLDELKESFDGAFLLKRGEIDEDHSSGMVDLKVEKSPLGIYQPVIYLSDTKKMTSDKLYFSHIGMVKRLIKNNPEEASNHIIFSYTLPECNGNGLEGKEMVLYDLLLKKREDPNLPASYFLALAQQYATKDYFVDCDKFDPSEEPRVYLSADKLESICKGDSTGLPNQYELKNLGQLNYKQCLTDSRTDENGLKSVMVNIRSALKDSPMGILVFCGNATKLRADECPYKDNILLSLYRAQEGADFISKNMNKELREVTSLPYTMGDLLDEQSMRVYYLSHKKWIKEAKK